jgi:hypothetical protein
MLAATTPRRLTTFTTFTSFTKVHPTQKAPARNTIRSPAGAYHVPEGGGLNAIESLGPYSYFNKQAHKRPPPEGEGPDLRP